MESLKIIWSNQAIESLRAIYDYYKDKSLQGAENVKNDLLKAPRKMVFSGQYQIDEINPKYRRIVVRDYKLLYQEEKGVIQIIDIISTRQSAEVLRGK